MMLPSKSFVYTTRQAQAEDVGKNKRFSKKKKVKRNIKYNNKKNNIKFLFLFPFIHITLRTHTYYSHWRVRK